MNFLQPLTLLSVVLSCHSNTLKNNFRTRSNSHSAFQNIRSPKTKAIITLIRTKQSSPFRNSSLKTKIRGNVLELEKEEYSSNDNVNLIPEVLVASKKDPNNISKGKSTGVLLNAAAILIVTVSGLAYSGFLSGFESGENVYTMAEILRDASATLFTTVSAGIFVKLLTTASKNGQVKSKDSRKILHSFSAPLFMFCWPIYSSMSGARFFAAIVPLLFGFRLFIAGNENNDYGDESELAKAVSRSGDVKEALQGPFIYSIILFIGVVAFWNSSLNGVVGISIMAAGDGAADIVGRRFGRNNKWAFNKQKSIAGTLAFFIFSLLTSVGLVYWFDFTGFMSLPTSGAVDLVTRLSAICGVSSIVEIIPAGDDNWTVPISAVFLSYILFN